MFINEAVMTRTCIGERPPEKKLIPIFFLRFYGCLALPKAFPDMTVAVVLARNDVSLRGIFFLWS